MRRYVARSASGAVYQVMGTIEARRVFESAKDSIDQILFCLPFVYFVSPLFTVVIFVFAVYRYRREIHSVFFIQKEVTAKYKQIFAPLVSKTLFSAIGYRVYPEELEDHLAIINSDEKEDMILLGEKGAKMRRNLTRQFGLNVDRSTRHIIFIGTTGAGKTETLMSLFIDILKNCSSLGMLDGKSDQMMEYKIYNLCKEHYYETQFYAIILNKPEKGTDSNSYSPLLSYSSAMKASEFLGEFIKGGEGNADYFANRGKVMLGNIVMHYKNRQKYYGENFSIGDLSSAISPIEMNNIYYNAYCIVQDIEKKIIKATERSLSFSRMMDKAKGVKTARAENTEHIELLYEYINQNAHLAREAEREIGIGFDFLDNYFSLYTLIGQYISGISPVWKKYVDIIAEVLYYHFTAEHKEFLYNAPSSVTMKEMRSVYATFKDAEHANYQNSIKLLGLHGKASFIDLFSEALGMKETPENAEKIKNESLQQHSYAEQQWGRLFGLFKEYSRITGTSYPDVDGEDIVKNNKVLYIMLPVMELSDDQVSMLGRMFILMFKNIASLALGGDRQSATPVQFKIYQNKIKPNPLFLMVLDEIGAYITTGISILSSQLRSLRIGMILSGQDVVSVQPEGNGGQREQARNLANMAKIVLQNRDADTHEFEKMIPEIEVIESDNFIHSAIGNRVFGSKNMSVKKMRTFEIAQSSRFSKGFGVYIDGARTETVYFQSYYIGDNADMPLQIRKFDAFENLYVA